MNEFTKLLIDTAAGSVQKYSSEDANTAIRKQFAEILHINEGEKSPSVIRRALRKYKADFYTLIEETVEDRMVSGWGDNPFFKQFVDERNLAMGDKNVFYVPDKSILTVSKFAGGHHDLNRQKLGMGTSYSVETSWYGIKVYDEFIRFQTGRVDWPAVIDKLYEAADRFLNDVLYKSFLGVENVIPAAFKETGTLTADKMLNLAEMVQIATGYEVIIAGTRPALSKLMNLTDGNWVSDAMKEQRNTSGLVTNFEGIETMVIPQVFAEQTTNKVYDTNKLYILPKADNKFIKLVWEGDTMFTENTTATANVDMTIEAEYMFKMGVAIIMSTMFGLYTIE